jgi:hypothetical protein
VRFNLNEIRNHFELSNNIVKDTIREWMINNKKAPSASSTDANEKKYYLWLESERKRMEVVKIIEEGTKEKSPELVDDKINCEALLKGV